jgi:hypothetical protein
MARAFRIWSVFVVLAKLAKALQEHTEEVQLLEEEIELLKGDTESLQRSFDALDAKMKANPQVQGSCHSVARVPTLFFSLARLLPRREGRT